MGRTRGRLATSDMVDAQGESGQGTSDAQRENGQGTPDVQREKGQGTSDPQRENGQGTPDVQRENGNDTPVGNVEEPEAITMRRLELEFELRRLQMESEERIALRRIQLESEGSTRSSTESRVGSQGPVDPLVQCAKVLKGHRLPCDADVPIWFDEVEKMFLTYRVPDEARVHLIMPALTERVRYLLRNLELEDCTDYEQVKRAVLDELQLAPPEYRERFDSTSKRRDENWTQFASRVRTYLSYYLRAREAESKETMLELLVADRLKASLSPDRLEYVLLREGETWLRAHEIAKVLQTYDQAKGTKRDAKGGKSRREDSELAPNQTHNGKVCYPQT
ncbi:uncharacterized protein ISCGN_019059 [Ixodes scapularis]